MKMDINNNKSLDPLRAKKTYIRKKLGHTVDSAIRVSSVTLSIWQKGARGKEPKDKPLPPGVKDCLHVSH